MNVTRFLDTMLNSLDACDLSRERLALLMNMATGFTRHTHDKRQCPLAITKK